MSDAQQKGDEAVSSDADIVHGDDPVHNEYTIDNIQKTRDNMGLNLNDEMVDIGNDLINYGRLHIHVLPHQMAQMIDENEKEDPMQNQAQQHFAAMKVDGDFVVDDGHLHRVNDDGLHGGSANGSVVIVVTGAVCAVLLCSFWLFYIWRNQSKKGVLKKEHVIEVFD